MRKILLILVASLFLVNLASAIDLNDSVISYYKLDNSSGNVADRLGINNGTNIGATRDIPGIVNNSFQFDGLNDQVNISTFNGWTSLNNFTINFWMNMSGASSPTDSIIRSQNSTALSFAALFRGQGALSFQVFNNSNTIDVFSSSTNLNNSNWRMITLRYNSTDTSIFVDGVLENSTSVNGNIYPISFITFGVRDGATDWWAGRLDEVGFWNRGLNESEVATIYNSGNPLTYPFIGNVVRLDNPLNDTNVSGNITFNATAQPLGDFNLSNATLFIYNSSGDLYFNQTNPLSGQNIQNTTAFSVTNLTADQYEWDVIAYSFNGSSTTQINSTGNFTFTWRPFIFNSFIYTLNTTEGALETYTSIINVTTGDTISTANMYYNGSLSSGSITNLGGGLYEANVTRLVPQVTNQQDVNFFWEIFTDAGFSANSSALTQTINNITIDDCTVGSLIILNYTLADEENRSLLNAVENGSIEVDVQLYSVTNVNLDINYSTTFNSNNGSICMSAGSLDSSSYSLYTTVNYKADNYASEYNYLQNATLNSSLYHYNITLYDLLATDSIEFSITYKDSTLIPVQGVIIELSRQYVGQGDFFTVEMMKTDADGKTVGHFVLNDVVYTLYVKKDGQLLATFEDVRAFCDDILTGDCKINLNELSSTSNPLSFQSYLDVMGTQSYNDTTKTYTFDFTTTDSSTKTVNLTIYKYDNFLNETICSKQITSSSGSLSCVIPEAYYNNSALAKILVDGVEYSSSPFTISVSNSSEQSPVRYFLAFLLIVSLPLLAFTSGPMTLIMFIIGLFIAGGLSLIDWGGYVGPVSAFLWFVVAAVILIIKASSRSQQV